MIKKLHQWKQIVVSSIKNQPTALAESKASASVDTQRSKPPQPKQTGGPNQNIKMVQKIFGDVQYAEKNTCVIHESVRRAGENILLYRNGSTNNIIMIDEGVFLRGLKISMSGRQNILHIKKGVRFTGHIIVAGSGRKMVIGENTTAQGVYILCRDANVTIGKDCMFSREIEIRATDVHKIYALDDEQGENRLNTPTDLVIGDHVWVGARSMISKSVVIGSGSIIGACSFVNKSYLQENVAIAGVPAKIVKEGIRWER